MLTIALGGAVICVRMRAGLAGIIPQVAQKGKEGQGCGEKKAPHSLGQRGVWPALANELRLLEAGIQRTEQRLRELTRNINCLPVSSYGDLKMTSLKKR